MAGLWVARDDGAAKARRVVTLGSPLRGTTLAGSAVAFAPDACPVACRQLAPGSAEVRELATAGVGRRLPWLSIWTTADQTVTPPDSARLDGAVDVALQDACGSGPGVARAAPGRPRRRRAGAARPLRRPADRAGVPGQLVTSFVAKFAHAAPNATSTYPACTVAPWRTDRQRIGSR